MTPFEFAAVHTERLTLRMMAEHDLDDILSYQGRDDVCRYLLYQAQTREQVAERISRHSRATALGKKGDYWQIAVEVAATDASPARVIGDLYFTITSIENSGGEIGWVFHPDFQGRGFAREAAAAVLEVAFDRVGLHRVTAELDPRNLASERLCRALGMRQEAFFVQDVMFRGEWADTGIYAILADEWNAARSTP